MAKKESIPVVLTINGDHALLIDNLVETEAGMTGYVINGGYGVVIKDNVVRVKGWRHQEGTAHSYTTLVVTPVPDNFRHLCNKQGYNYVFAEIRRLALEADPLPVAA